MKKRVERSSDDPTTVVTTYEGQHTHPCPVTPRGTIGIAHSASAAESGAFMTSPFGGTMPLLPTHHHQQYHQYHPYIYSSTPSLSNISTSNTNISGLPSFVQERHNYNYSNMMVTSSSASHSLVMRDHGLLQDIVPTQMRKEDQESNN